MMNNPKNSAVEFWRFFFTVLICFLHFEPVYREEGNRIFTCCYLGVEFFFILSGFFLMRHLEKDKESSPTRAAGKYTLGRIKRLYPHIMLGWFAYLAWNVFYYKWSFRQIFDCMRIHIWEFLLMHATMISTDWFLGQVWYISAMLLTGYFIYWAVKWNKEISVGGGGMFIVLYVYRYYSWQPKFLDLHLEIVSDGGLTSVSATNRAMAGMLLGCIVYFIYGEIKKHEFTKKQYYLLSVLEIVSLFLILKIMLFSVHNRENMLVLFLFPILIICEYGQFTVLSKILNNRVSAYLGKISLMMYLLHYPLALVIFLEYSFHESYLAGAFIYISYVIILAALAMAGEKVFGKIFGKILSGKGKQ